MHVDVRGYGQRDYEYRFADNADSKIKPVRITSISSVFDQVMSTKPEDNPPGSHSAGLSIANELGGDTNVLMFVRNRVSYYRFPVPKGELLRNYPKNEANNALRQQMINMMDPVPGLTFVNDHNYGSR